MKVRNFYLDNIKFILIFLVVFGHYIEPFIHDNELMMVIYKLIYAFHMPLFAFATGFFSKPLKSIKDLKKPLLQFLTFELIYAITIGITLVLRPENMSFFSSQVGVTSAWSNLMLILTPVWILWFLIAMMFWKIFITLLPKNKFIIIGSIVVALFIGTISVFEGALAIQRVFCFFPFYYIGYYLTTRDLNKIVAKFKKIRMSAIFILPMFSLLFMALNYRWLYFADSYAKMEVTNVQGIIIRSLLLAFATYLSLLVLTFVPSEEKKYSKYGSLTLPIYLGHGLIMIGVLFFNVFSFSINVFTFVLLIVLVLITIYVLTIKRVSKVFDILSWSKL